VQIRGSNELAHGGSCRLLAPHPLEIMKWFQRLRAPPPALGYGLRDDALAHGRKIQRF
jgi:hypothetical protein